MLTNLELIRRRAVGPSLDLAVRTAAILAVGFIVVAITGCNTMEGAGQDIQKAGEKLEEKADENK